MSRIPRAAFLKMGSFSHANEKVLEILRDNFPQYDIVEIDILTEFINRKDALMFFHCLKEYGKKIISGKQSVPATFLRTPYVFHKVRRTIRERLSGQGWAFTFQTQSIFDASLPGVPHFVYTDHTHLANLRYPGFDPQKLFSRSWIECEKTIYENASLNFTMSSNISRSIIADYACRPDRVSCVFCGANVQAAEDDTLDPDRFSRKNILFVGIDWQRKGGPVLVEAFKDVLIAHPDATLTIVGCSPKVDLPNTNVVGRIPLPEVKRFFRQAAVFCLPTRLEPFGIVFLEAMAHKLPLVGTDIGAIPDFIVEGKNGHMVKPDDPKMLAGKLRELLSSPETCRDFGEFGYRLFSDRYNWKQTGAKIREGIMPFLA